LQVLYEYYQPTDTINHMTGALVNPVPLPGGGVKGGNSSPTFSQLEIERGRLFFDGTVFDPNLRFRIDLDGNTRGVPAQGGGGVPTGNGFNSAGGVAGVGDGNTVALTDHAVRLQGAFIAYDWHPCGYEKGCGPDCPDGAYRYTPTVTAFFGKFKPFIGMEEMLLPFSQQFVAWSMADWFFDADDDGWQMELGTQIKAFDDRLYAVAYLTNGNEAATASNLQLDDLPGVNAGFWYDLGGTWNAARGRWDLFGDCLSDIDYSCNPVVRVGGAVNLVPMDRRSEFDVTELNRIRVVPGGPGGTPLPTLLNGGGINNNSVGLGQFALDAADEYTYEVFAGLKYRGFSLSNDWWFRDVNNLRGRRQPAGNFPGNGVDQPILYTTTLPGGAATPTLFTARGLFDYGMQLQGGYFLIQKKLELVARWSYIRGNSGNIFGNGTFTDLSTAQKTALGIPNPATTTVRVFNNDFKNFQEVDEYAVGVNYFFKRHMLKWQTDLSFYQGGNPASGGQSAAGFIPGVDGWMVRSQVQVGF
jgi:hypothetical protein